MLDLDGTLLDTARLYEQAFMAACAELGLGRDCGGDGGALVIFNLSYRGRDYDQASARE